MEGHGSSQVSQIYSHLKDNKMITMGYLYNLVRVNDLDQEFPSIDSMSIVNEFTDIFLEELPRIPPEHEIYFDVDLDPNTKKFLFPCI